MYGIDEFADMIEFQSSRSLRTATCGYYRLLGEFAISILAVLADRDQCPENVNNPHSISILAVLADRDTRDLLLNKPVDLFQSSRSVRTATTVRRM